MEINLKTLKITRKKKLFNDPYQSEVFTISMESTSQKYDDVYLSGAEMRDAVERLLAFVDDKNKPGFWPYYSDVNYLLMIHPYGFRRLDRQGSAYIQSLIEYPMTEIAWNLSALCNDSFDPRGIRNGYGEITFSITEEQAKLMKYRYRPCFRSTIDTKTRAMMRECHARDWAGYRDSIRFLINMCLLHGEKKNDTVLYLCADPYPEKGLPPSFGWTIFKDGERFAWGGLISSRWREEIKYSLHS